MVAFTYSRVIAANYNTTPPTVAKSATGSVYAIADTTFTTPLNLTLVVGGVTTTSISADSSGIFPDFTVNDRTSVVWKQAGSPFSTVLTTTDPVPGPKGDPGNSGSKGDKGDRGDLAAWQPTTFYPLNQVLSDPLGNLVRVTTSHTSGASYDSSKFEYAVPPTLTPAALNATYVPKWKAATAYLAGDKVLSPNGDVVSAKVNFTSGASYDSANWNLSTTFATNAALGTVSNPRRFGRPQFRIIPGGAWSFPAGLDAGATLDTAYADVNPLGTTAARVLTAGSGAPVMRQTFTAPVDMTGKQWIIWVKLPDMTLTKNLTLYAYDSTLSSANMWTFPVYGPVSNLNSPKYVIHPNVWTPLTIPWDPTTTTGAPNRAAVNRIHLGMSDNATGVPVDFRFASKVGMVDVAPAFTNGAVSITIDDSVSLDVVKPKLTQYGYPATLFPIGESLGAAGRPTVADLRTLVDNLGWEVAAHAALTADHVSVEDLSQADRLANFGRVKAWHTANGFPADVYAWPNGTSSEPAFADLRGFYSVARGVGTGWLETLPPGRPEYLRTIVVSAATTAAAINAYVDRAVASNSWLILCFHSVVASGATGQATNQSVFDAIIDYVATKNTKVLTVGDVMAKV